MEERAIAFANILSNRRKRKFQRDKTDLEKPLNFSNKILHQLQNNNTLVLNEKLLKEKLLESQKIRSFEPLNLQRNAAPLTDGSESLCSKGRSFHHFTISQSHTKVMMILHDKGNRFAIVDKDIDKIKVQ